MVNSYDLSRNFTNFAFENPQKIKPNHYAIYFFAIEHCNRLGWKKVFGLPTTMTMEAIGIRSYKTYINALRELVDWGFIEMVEVSKNQHSSNIVALANFTKALDKALDKAWIKHGLKQDQSTDQSIASIDKQETKEQINNKQGTKGDESPPSKKDKFIESVYEIEIDLPKHEIERFIDYWTEKNPRGRKMKFEKEKTFDPNLRLKTWQKNLEEWNKNKEPKQDAFQQANSEV